MKFGKKFKIASKKNLIEVQNSINKEFDSEPVSNDTAKIKPYNGKINKNFHNNKIPKEGS